MVRSLCALLGLVAMFGCAPLRPRANIAANANPALVPTNDHEYLWEQIVDVVNDDFPIQREERVRQVGDLITEGVLEIAPQIGATVFEPWHGDSASSYERWESTLQTIRRRGVVRVVPASGGYHVEVLIFKELEDLPKPMRSTAGEATFRADNSLQRYREPVGEFPQTVGWIPMGRDPAAEARILSRILARFQ